ncbi:hypothetical protein VPH35_062992 [Triticum aestivum]
MVLQRSIHSAARRRQSCNAAAMVLQCSIHGAIRRRRKLQSSIHGARPELQSSLDGASVLRWSSAGVARTLRRSHWSSIGAAMEFAGGSLLCWTFVGSQWSSSEAINAALELPAGLQWRCVEAVALTPAYCHPTTPNILSDD